MVINLWTNVDTFKIFQEGKLSHFVDGRGPTGGWMSFVNCARYAQEQNLIAIQVDGDIFYEACKDIPNGTELLVWYGECYLQFMGVPVSLKEMADGGVPEEINCKYISLTSLSDWLLFAKRPYTPLYIANGKV